MLFLLATGKRKGQTTELLLFGITLAFLWFQVEFFLIRNKLDVQFPFVYSTRYGSWLIVGPLIWLYNKATLNESFKISRKHLLHFLPFLIFTLILPLFFEGWITKRSTNYGMLTVFDRFNFESITFKHYLYGVVFIVQFLHATAYIFLSFVETRQFNSKAKNQHSNLPEAKLNTLKYLYFIGLLIILLCSAFTIFQFSTTMWKRNFDYLYVLPMLIFIFGLTYRAIKYPGAIFSNGTGLAKVKYLKSGLTDLAKQTYLEKLEVKLNEEKLYRNNDLRLTDLANELNISVHHLSQIINEEKQQNFFDFINTYRVKEAQEKIASGESRTLLEVAYAVGFNNKNSFNAAFKKHVGMTPSSYKKAV